jgi:hemoglobin
MPAIEELMIVFYRKVRQDSVLAPLFAQMSDAHPQHVAHFVAEVLEFRSQQVRCLCGEEHITCHQDY